MSDFIGAALVTGLLWFAIECVAGGRFVLAALLIIAVLAVLRELSR